MPNHPVFGAFDQGATPTITCINKASVSVGYDFPAMVSALQRYIDEYFAPIWGTPAKLLISESEVQGAWALMFLDDADVANALGYHDLTEGGLPLSNVFVKTTLASGEKIPVTASHEIAEMLVDPAINMWTVGPNSIMYAYEAADACEEETFDIDGIPMSDFVHPAYFESFRAARSRKFDHCGKIEWPFQILQGGYSIIMKEGKQSQIFGSLEKADRFDKEDRRGHRAELREKILMAGDAQLGGTFA